MSNNGKVAEQGNVEGVIRIEGQGSLAKEFITVGRTFEEALGRCVIRDDHQRNALIVYKAQLELFGMEEEISDLTNWLNASSAVGGYNRSLTAMTDIGIFMAEGAGLPLDKDSKKALLEMQRMRIEKKDNKDGDKTD